MKNAELIARLRSFETDHKPEGWPAIQMRDVSALLDAIEALEAENASITNDALKFVAERDALAAQLAAAQGQCDTITELNHAQWLALENVRMLAARNRKEEWAQHLTRFCNEAGNVNQILRAAPIPQQVAVPAECCEHCDDGDGLCVFPMYGPAPHTHDTSSGWIGSTRTLPKEQWGNNFREDPDCKGHGVYMRCESCGRGEQQATAPSVPEGWKQAVALAYGHLWHVNNEPMAPIPLRSSETAAYEARKQLRDLLTHEERGLAINQVQALLAAAPQPKETK